MIETLNRIKQWVEENANQTLDHLNGPASSDDIKRVEEVIGIQLPDDFKEFLKIHDGEVGDGWLALLGNGNQLLSCNHIIKQYELDQQIGEDLYDPDMETIEFWKDRVGGNVIFVNGPVKPLMLHRKWIPLTCMNGDVFRYFDFDPAPGGIPGQIIEVDPEGCCYEVIATNFSELLEKHLSELQAGDYVVDEEGYIESKEEKRLDWGVPEWLKNA